MWHSLRCQEISRGWWRRAASFNATCSMHRVVQYLPTLLGPDRECLSRQVFLAYVGSVPDSHCSWPNIDDWEQPSSDLSSRVEWSASIPNWILPLIIIYLTALSLLLLTFDKKNVGTYQRQTLLFILRVEWECFDTQLDPASHNNVSDSLVSTLTDFGREECRYLPEANITIHQVSVTQQLKGLIKA